MQRGRYLLPVVAGVVLLVVLFGRQGAALIVDWWWFDASGFASVFTTALLARVVMGLGAGAFVLVTLGLSANLALRGERPRPPQQQPSLRVVTEEGAPPPAPVAPSRLAGFLTDRALPKVVWAAAAGLAGVLGLGASASWQHALLFLNKADFGWVDPVLGRDAGFYVFTLPLLQDLRGLVLAAVVLALAGTTAVYGIRGLLTVKVEVQGERVQWKGIEVADSARVHLASLLTAALVVGAVGPLLQRFSLLYDPTGLMAGPGYTMVHVTMPLLLLQAVLTLVAAGLALAAALRLSVRLAIGAGGSLGVGVLLVTAVPGLVQRFSVLPNELVRERPYLESHIEATRLAWGLGGVSEANLSGEAELSRHDIEANQLTIQNVRLWDHAPLLDTFSQVQEIRTYYEFASVDNDRYVLDGELRQIMLSPRELVPTGLPARARTWVNESLVYTHGYGLALGPVNQVTAQGLPELFVKDLPPQVDYPDVLGIDRPELYFGEVMARPVFVRTANPEFNYPTSDGNAYLTYDGSGGVRVGGLLGKAVIAAHLRDVKVLLSSDFTDETRVLLYRRVVDRAHKIAPFLRYDRDPYLVIADGRLVWVLDAYTSTRRFPYAEGLSLGRYPANYARNSVKITVDAYDGDLTFYAIDPTDPILQAWAGVFPDLFTPIDELSPTLREHLRYPQDLFSAQTTLFATYHMTDPQMFYNREDEWEVPAPNGQPMEPYYTVMKLPSSDAGEEFIVMLPFVPRDKPNLAAWMVARSDGERYGELLAYKFPKDSMVWGPEMIVARINQDDAISEKLSLWNQQGSRAILGTLLVIPLEESLLYVQPLYLQAESSAIPELKRVIVGYENEIAMEPTLDAAIDRIFGEDLLPSPLPPTSSRGTSPSAPSQPSSG